MSSSIYSLYIINFVCTTIIGVVILLEVSCHLVINTTVPDLSCILYYLSVMFKIKLKLL